MSTPVQLVGLRPDEPSYAIAPQPPAPLLPEQLTCRKQDRPRVSRPQKAQLPCESTRPVVLTDGAPPGRPGKSGVHSGWTGNLSQAPSLWCTHSYTATEEGRGKDHATPRETRCPDGLVRGCAHLAPRWQWRAVGQSQQHLALPWARQAPVRSPDPGPQSGEDGRPGLFRTRTRKGTGGSGRHRR